MSSKIRQQPPSEASSIQQPPKTHRQISYKQKGRHKESCQVLTKDISVYALFLITMTPRILISTSTSNCLTTNHLTIVLTRPSTAAPKTHRCKKLVTLAKFPLQIYNYKGISVSPPVPSRTFTVFALKSRRTVKSNGITLQFLRVMTRCTTPLSRTVPPTYAKSPMYQ